MIKLSNQSANQTSFHDSTITCTYADLVEGIGEPQESNNRGEDKVNFCWTCETESGEVFTIYDWKEYRQIDEFDEIEWHIGGYSRSETEEALSELLNHLGL